MRIIAIDGGTTNTKIFLVENGEILGREDTVGAKFNKDRLYKIGIKGAIKKLLSDNSLTEGDIEKIICSGMITSDIGLCTLPHLTVPCGLEEMAEGVFETVLPEISEIPFIFIRGVKTGCDSLETADMMRGEETEFIGISDGTSADSVYIFPGTHSKIIYTDGKGRIAAFSTEFTGELIEVVANHSILKDSVDMSHSEFDSEYLLKGYDYAKENGLNSALFKVRILKNLFGAEPRRIYSFFIGAALSGEIGNIVKTKSKSVIIVGRHPLCTATDIILKSRSDKVVENKENDGRIPAAVAGMLKIYSAIKEEGL